jgi:hypothetical protein
MQQPKDTRSADPYLTWQDLLDEEADDGAPAAGAVPDSQPQPTVAYTTPLPTEAEVKLPPAVEALLAEKERLEEELKRLAGFGDPRPEDERLKRMYPVKVHTKESRIEERRLRQHDEHQRLLKQRAMEAKLAQAREARRQAEAEAERRRKAIEQALARLRAQIRQAEAEAERRRKAIERVQADRRAAERQAEYAAEQQRKAIEMAAVQTRWANDRQKALQQAAQKRRQEAIWQEQSLQEQRMRALQLARAKKAEQAEDLAKKRTPPTEKRTPKDQRDNVLNVRDNVLKDRIAQVRTDEDKRADSLERLAQQKSQALRWEQDRERQRQQALARRRADQAVSQQLDQRGKNKNRFASTDDF